MKAIALLFPLLLGAAAPNTGVIAWVIDGDTFRLGDGVRIRIAGIDAPESDRRHAHCQDEIQKGKAATRATIQILKGQSVSFQPVGRSYNRTVAKVWLRGRDVAAILVERGIAQWWPRGKAKPDWCQSSHLR